MRINIISSSSSSMMIILVSIVLLMINIIDVSSMENNNDNNRQNKAPEFPSGGFNIITQPRNTMVQNHYQGSMENGYPYKQKIAERESNDGIPVRHSTRL